MARCGLGQGWDCLFANDFDQKKVDVYSDNWGKEHVVCGDIAELATNDLPAVADLAWASFPCQDLSLAGAGAGLKGKRSGTFWAFWGHMQSLAKKGGGPSIVALENVCGTLTSHEGKDFTKIADALARSGYRFGALIINAVDFVPQSRPRLFIVAVKSGLPLPEGICGIAPDDKWHPNSVLNAYARLSQKTKKQWIWWSLPMPPKRNSTFIDLIEDDPVGVAWNTTEQTERLLSMMSAINLQKVEKAKAAKKRFVGGVYKRTRNGVQRAEVRFDDVAGCLRTPAGGSSRQTIIIVEGNRVRTRLLSPRETARLMGLPEDYLLPKNYNAAYHLAGDGVVVPVVRHLAENLFEPVLEQAKDRKQAAA